MHGHVGKTAAARVNGAGAGEGRSAARVNGTGAGEGRSAGTLSTVEPMHPTRQCLWTATSDGHPTLVDGAWLSRIGCAEGELSELVQAADRDRVRSARSPEPPAPYTVDYRLRGNDGATIAVSESGAPRFAADGTLEGWFGACVATDAESRGAPAGGPILPPHYPLLVWHTDVDGQFDFFNDTWLEFTGRTLEEELGRGWMEGIHPDDRERCVAACEQAVAAHEPFEVEFRFRRRDGQYRWVVDWGLPFDDDEGRHAGYTGSIQDVTAQFRATAVREGQNRFLEQVAMGRPLVEAITTLTDAVERYGEGSFASVLILDEDGRTLRNLAAPSLPPEYVAAIDGFEAGPCAGSCGTAVYERRLVIVEDIATDPLWENFRDTALAHGLRACWSCPITFGGDRVLGSFAIYYTEPRRPSSREVELIESMARIAGIAIQRSREEAALRVSEEQLRQAQKMEAVGRLAAGIAHDFNNVLVVVQGHAELMLDGLDPEADERLDLNQIIRASKRAAKLTQQLLAFGRKQILQLRVLDLNEVIRGVEAMLAGTIREDIELVISLDSELGRVRADPGQIEQVLLNLTVNASDAMPDGGKLEIATRNIEVGHGAALGMDGLVRQGPGALMTVSDSGCGMDRETAQHAFDPFFTTKGPGKGTGLGLSMVYGVVKQSGGDVAVDSAPGAGTTVTIFLPHTSATSEESTGIEALPPAPDGSETILLVEDDESVRQLTVRGLESYGYTVLEARHGREGLAICRRHPGPIDLMITDIVMPEMGGFEVADQAAAIRPEMRVLYVTGYTDLIAGERSDRVAGDALLQKPFTPSQLVTRVRKLIEA